MQYQDYYQILGVSRDASAEEIKKTFRKLARKYHPDVSKEPDAEQRMQEVNEAYAVLFDPEKRAAYDQVGKGFRSGEDFRPPPGWDEGFEFSNRGFSGPGADGFSDFFAELFGQMGRGSPRGSGRGNGHGSGRGFQQHASAGVFQARGEDHHAKVYLYIEDAYHGATHQIGLRAPKVGEDGRVEVETRTLNVKIPKGVYEGQVIRLAGQGSPGAGGGPGGDLLLEVCFKPHPRLRAEGRNVFLDLPLAPWEAALGAVVPVSLPGGEVNVRIPAGSQAGRQLRVRGKGIPGEPPGDVLLNLQVVLPPADSERAKELYEAMARDLAFDPRRGAKP